MSILTAPDVRMQPASLSQEFIARTLDLYKTPCIAIESASWDGYHVVSRVRPLEYPFTEPGHIDYVTGGMALLYASQAAYLVARLMILSGSGPADVPLSDHDFFNARDSGDLVFMDLSLRFRRKLRADTPSSRFTLRQSLGSLRATRSHILGRLTGDLGDGACSIAGVLAFPVAGAGAPK